MPEETEEEFKARMAAISSGYKKDRSERKVQLAEEGKALARKRDQDDITRSDPSDPRYGIGGDMYGRGGYIGEPGMISRHIAASMRMIMMAARERDYRRTESIDMDFLLGLADYLNHLDPKFPRERDLRDAIRYGLGREGRDHVHLMDEPEAYYVIGRPEPVDHSPSTYRTVSMQGMKDAISAIDDKYSGFRMYLNRLMEDFRHGRPLGDVHYQLQSFIMDRETRAMRERAIAPKIIHMDLEAIEGKILELLGSKEAVFRYLYGGMKKMVDESHTIKMEVKPKREPEAMVYRDPEPEDKRAWMKFQTHSRNPKRR